MHQKQFINEADQNLMKDYHNVLNVLSHPILSQTNPLCSHVWLQHHAGNVYIVCSNGHHDLC